MLTAKEKQVIGEAIEALEAVANLEIIMRGWTDALRQGLVYKHLKKIVDGNALASLRALENEGGEAPVEAGKVCTEKRVFNIGSKEVADLNAACCVHLEEFLDEMNVGKASAVTITIEVHGTGQATPEANQ